MKYLVCLLEEPSAAEMLKGILPRVLPQGVYAQYVVFEGKQDLEKQLEHRLRLWQQPDSVFLVMRDKDSGNCVTIKQNLTQKIISSGRQDTTVIRIACHELESFFLGDLIAVEDGLKINGLAQKQNKQKYRTPDCLSNASEELFKLTRKQYQKIAGSRAIGPHLKTDGTNRSHSFNVLLKGIRELAGTQ